MAEWRQSTWGDEVSLEYGKSLRDYTNSLGPVRVYGSNGAIGYTNRELSKGPGVILGRKGAYRGVEYSKGPFFVIDTAYYVIPKTELDMRWLYYAIKYHKLGEIDDGSPIPSTTRSAVYVRNLEVPSLEEQCAISAVLEALDNKIEINNQMNKTLEAMAQALFKSWFVDFDPVKAKAEGRKPEGMEDAIAALFPSDFTESTLGQIPLGWKVTPLANICENIFSGGTPSTQIANYWNGNIPWLSSGETRDRFIIDTEKTITEEGVTNSSTRLARHGCTVIAGAGQGHTRGQTSLLMLDSYINQSVVALKANPEISSDFFLFFDLARRYEEFRQLSDSHSSRGSLTTKLLSGVKVVFPTAELIQKFDDAVRPSVAKIAANLHNSRTLTNLRDVMLPRLISGELRVGEVSEIVKALAL